MINIKRLDPNKVKIDKESYKNILIFNKNDFNERSDGNNYLMVVSTYESKDTLKEYEKLWNKIRDFTRSMTNKQLGQL